MKIVDHDFYNWGISNLIPYSMTSKSRPGQQRSISNLIPIYDAMEDIISLIDLIWEQLGYYGNRKRIKLTPQQSRFLKREIKHLRNLISDLADQVEKQLNQK